MPRSPILSKEPWLANTPADTLTNNTDNAYVGLGGPNCNSIDPADAGTGNRGTGDCFYYNSFQTSVFDPVTNARWDTSDTSRLGR